MDVEGAEDLVVSGGGALFRHHSPAIGMEYLSQSRHNAGHQKAADYLAEWSYRPFAIDNDGELKALPDIHDYLASCKLDSDNIVFRKVSA